MNAQDIANFRRMSLATGMLVMLSLIMNTYSLRVSEAGYVGDDVIFGSPVAATIKLPPHGPAVLMSGSLAGAVTHSPVSR